MNTDNDTSEVVEKPRSQRIHDWLFAVAAIAATAFGGLMLGRTVTDSTSSRNPWVIALVLVIMAGVALVALRQTRITHTHEPIEEDQ